MGTAYVNRPSEYGVDQKIDLEASEIWDFIDDSLEGLAEKLGCQILMI